MTVYPFAIDSDTDLIRIDDQITELGGEAINQLRDAVFAIEKELGIRPSGSAGSLASRFDVAHNADGSIKSSALMSVGLATLPISDSQVGTNAGIQEFKLSLDHSTADLYTIIIANQGLLNSLNTFAQATDSDLSTHIGGGKVLSDGAAGRHVASHIDLNAVPVDTRDSLYSWAGLQDKDGNDRTAATVAEALDQINTSLVNHENATSAAHNAEAVDIDVSNFETVPTTVNTVQKFADYIDDFDAVTIRHHRQTGHANSVLPIARSTGMGLPDGYGWENVIPETPVTTYLSVSPNTQPVDSISNGDDVVRFNPDNSDFLFDSLFVNVRVGDIVRINYANGMEASYSVESVRFNPGTEWFVRINGYNLANTDGYARIDRPLADRSTAGVLAVAAANATPTGNFNNILQSAIVGHPRGAVAVGLGFDPNQLDATHYKLYIDFYPTGNPSDRIISLPFIDVTGDTGQSPGQYTLQSVVQAINNNFTQVGYSYRLIAFAHEGEVGIMCADAIGSASFSIISGVNSSGTLIEGSFTENVIGDSISDGFDALGLGQTHADVAGPKFISSFVDSTAALLPAKIIRPRKNRYYISDGAKLDTFAPTWLATLDENGNGYWDGYISARNVIGSSRVETTYAVLLDLKPAGLKPGKTIVVQPDVSFDDALYSDVDYGRFIIKSVNYSPECPGESAQTLITVISGVHATGVGLSSSGTPTLPVKLYFGQDSVGFNIQNVIDTSLPSTDYHRLHEVFVDSQGKTFSHERGRLPLQSETSELLSTTAWHIQNISPKLKGYRDNTDSFNRFVRLYILEYNTLTGEFDGYIGQRAPTTKNISNVGPVTKGRKGVPTRFYDASNIDYIDLVYDEVAASFPGTAILSDGTTSGGGTPRYVDIELFSSMQLVDEYLLLATAEVNWDPQASQDVVERVIDRREFGSIDEEDFTSSAKDFISAGDKHLHENGIIRGFDFDFINPTDNREIFFKGGLAFVDGTVTTSNAQSVTIPEVYEDGYSTPATVTWAICVNKFNNLVSIVITSTKRQFYAVDNVGSGTYYIDSVTFSELINVRKNLVPIYTVNASIASVTIADSDLGDVRRNVSESGFNDTLTLSSNKNSGNFFTFRQAVNWINNYYASGTYVKEVKINVKGAFEVNNSISITPNVPITFEGDGAKISVTSDRGFIISDNVSFKNIAFDYNPDISLSSTNYINTGNGCIYHGNGSDCNGLKLDNCLFSSSISAARPPFINIELDSGEILSDFLVQDCTFTDTGDGYRAAVAVVGVGGGSSADPAYVVDSFIHRNKCQQKQGIYITSVDSGGTLVTPGLGVSSVSIRDNSAGVIGYLITSQSSSALLNSSSNGRGRSSSLVIEGNSAHFIGTVLSDGLVASERITNAGGSGQITYALGNVVVSNNTANWMDFHIGDDGDVSSSLVVKDNTLNAYNSSYYSLLLPSSSAQVAIYVNVLSSDDVGSCIISNNNINGTGLLSGGLYNTAILSNGSCKILNNEVNGFTSVGITGASISGLTREYLIQGNSVNRENRTVSRFIFAGNSTDIITVTDNILDSNTVDGGSVVVGTSSLGSVIGASSPDRIIERNINQTESININVVDSAGIATSSSGTDFRFLTDTITSSINEGGPFTSSFNPLMARLNYNETTSVRSFYLRSSLFKHLPDNVRVTDASVTLDASANASGGGNYITGTLTITRSNTTSVDDTDSVTTAGVTLSANPGTVRNTASNNLVLEVKCEVLNGSTLQVFVSSITVTYRW